jgi:hypothetical protein
MPDFGRALYTFNADKKVLYSRNNIFDHEGILKTFRTLLWPDLVLKKREEWVGSTVFPRKIGLWVLMKIPPQFTTISQAVTKHS